MTVDTRPGRWDAARIERTAARSESREESTIVADRDGVIRDWGDYPSELLGYAPEEAMGKRVDLIVPPVLQDRHWKGFHAAVESGRLKRGDKPLRVPAIHRDGSVVPLKGVLALGHGEDRAVESVTLTVHGRGSSLAATAWRTVLGALRVGARLRPGAGR